MSVGAAVREMYRFTTTFQRPDGSNAPEIWGGWRPKFTYLEYTLDGGAKTKTAVTIDVASLRDLLTDHGFWFRDDVDNPDNAGAAQAVATCLFELADMEMVVSRDYRDDGGAELRMKFYRRAEYGGGPGQPYADSDEDDLASPTNVAAAPIHEPPA
jgi:hypothetical protein